MTQRRYARDKHEGLISAAAFGAFLIIVGLLFATNTALAGAIGSFFDDVSIVGVPNTSISLLAPAHPNLHIVVYKALYEFSFAIAILQVAILVVRFSIRSFRRIPETVGNLVFWSGAAYLVSTYLNNTTTISRWFGFWALILIVLGLSLIARAIVLIIKRLL